MDDIASLSWLWLERASVGQLLGYVSLFEASFIHQFLNHHANTYSSSNSAPAVSGALSIGQKLLNWLMPRGAIDCHVCLIVIQALKRAWKWKWKWKFITCTWKGLQLVATRGQALTWTSRVEQWRQYWEGSEKLHHRRHTGTWWINQNAEGYI